MAWEPIAKDYDPLKAGSIDGTDTEPHDLAVVRATQVEYYPNSRVMGEPKSTIFISRLNPKTPEDTVKKTFSKYGPVARCRLIRDLVTGYSKRYAFIEYEDERSAYHAYRDANKLELEGCELFVDYECERTMKGWIPRRLGGGLGGKKESGQLRFGGRDRPFRKPIVVGQEKPYVRNDFQARREQRNGGDNRGRPSSQFKYRRY